MHAELESERVKDGGDAGGAGGGGTDREQGGTKFESTVGF